MEKNGEISFRREVSTLILRSGLQTLHGAVQSDLGLVILVHALLMLQALFGACLLYTSDAADDNTAV